MLARGDNTVVYTFSSCKTSPNYRKHISEGEEFYNSNLVNIFWCVFLHSELSEYSIFQTDLH